MSTTSIQSQYNLKVHLYTFVVSVLFCILTLVLNNDFGKENIDGATIIILSIFILLSQIIALGGNVYKVRTNPIVVSFCYSILGILIGFVIVMVISSGI